MHLFIVHIQASSLTGDYLWRMPLYVQYTKMIESQIADLSNVGTKGRYMHGCLTVGLWALVHQLKYDYIQWYHRMTSPRSITYYRVVPISEMSIIDEWRKSATITSIYVMAAQILTFLAV